jgi:RNA polymerase sigma-70 factor (ECF subfamily)
VSMEEMSGIEISDDVPGPEATLSRVEEQRRIRALLGNLDPVDRAAVVMYYWYDFSYEEIGAALSLTVSAVKSRLHRARSAMAQRWIDQPALAQSVERTRHVERSPVF